MLSEPITVTSVNTGAFQPGNGFFNATMLCAALGFAPGNTNEVGAAVDIGALAAPDYRPSNNAGEWMWLPSTVQPYMTAAAALTLRNAVIAAYSAGRITRQ